MGNLTYEDKIKILVNNWNYYFKKTQLTGLQINLFKKECKFYEVSLLDVFEAMKK